MSRKNTTRLGLERLDDRMLLSVTPTLLAGTLRVTGDAANDSARVFHPTVGTKVDLTKINVVDNTTKKVTTFAAARVTIIEMHGSDGNDTLFNATAKPALIFGGNGNDALVGGPGGGEFIDGGLGDDVFYGSLGNDTYIGGAGQDVLHRRGTRAILLDTVAEQGDLNVGLAPANTRLTAAQLEATGDLTVSLDGQRLLFAGPTGAGFALRSSWAKVGNGFQTTTPISLETYYGQVTLPSVGLVPTRVELTGTPVGNAGVYENITWGGVPVTGTTNPLNGILDQATNGIGLDVNLPGVSWGIGLGSKVKELDGSAPVNNSVPYLYVRASTGYSLSYANATVSTPFTFTGTFAFAPGDGTVYAAVGGLPVVGDLGVAVSPKGYLPYTPKHVADGVSDPGIYGHVYTRGALSLDKVGAPVAIRGEMVLDLDANDDGRVLGLTKENVATTARNFQRGLTDPKGTLLNLANGAFNDVAVGFNGGVDLEVETLSLDLGNASAWYKPGQVAFRAVTTNPFADEPILKDFVSVGVQFDVQGYYDWTGGKHDWRFQADAASGKVFGFGGGSISLMAGNQIEGGGAISARATVTGLAGMGTVTVAGTVRFNGDFSLIGFAQFNASAGSIAGINGQFTVTLARANGRFTAGVRLFATAWADIRILNAGAIANIAFSMTVDAAGQVNYSGGGSITGWVGIPGVTNWSVTIGFGVDNSGLALYIADFPEIRFGW